MNEIEKKVHSKAPGYLNLFGDFLHNILDGLAIGVAFSGGQFDLVTSTLIATIAHEIPQEVGDTGILLKCGFTPKQVLIFNGLANLSALVGVLVGLLIG